MEDNMNFVIKLSILIVIILIFPFYVYGQIVFGEHGKWKTTFDYGPCSQRGVGGETNCDHVQNDGVAWSWGGGVGPGNTYTQATPDANYPGGGGGMGARFWNYDGHNSLSGPIRISFPAPQKEIWVRWYMRFQEGFRWNTGTGHNNENPPFTEHRIHFNKTFIIRTGAAGADVVPYLNNAFRFRTQGGLTTSTNFSGGGWDDSMGPGLSDGEWYCFEFYMKMNSSVGSADGIGRWWVNGVLYGEADNIRWDNANSTSHQGWTWMDFNNNQSRVENINGPIGLNYAYIDYDDMVIYNQTPPNSDEHGNPFIGPLPPAPPWGLSIDVQ